MTDAEDAAITLAAASDPDNPPLTDADFARMRPSAEVNPETVARARRARGPQKTPTKEKVAIRLSQDVLSHFRATGPGWQTRIDDALRAAMGGRPARP
ncbi:BrnA antitoxin family protein [Xanthobacter agilis]|uniref:BrnA antitoxin family protein n=1 Tax=Xanthobacter agilis TaxID=47492 RepID=UPI0037264FDE